MDNYETISNRVCARLNESYSCANKTKTRSDIELQEFSEAADRVFERLRRQMNPPLILYLPNARSKPCDQNQDYMMFYGRPVSVKQIKDILNDPDP